MCDGEWKTPPFKGKRRRRRMAEKHTLSTLFFWTRVRSQSCGEWPPGRTAKKSKNNHGDAPDEILVICENDRPMLRNGNLGLKIGLSRAAHTQYAVIIMEVDGESHNELGAQRHINFL